MTGLYLELVSMKGAGADGSPGAGTTLIIEEGHRFILCLNDCLHTRVLLVGFRQSRTYDRGGGRGGKYEQILTGSFSAVSKPMFASKC